MSQPTSAKCSGMIAFVRSVIAAFILDSSVLSVSGLMSTNTGAAPWGAKAFAVKTKVYEGMITSSPAKRLLDSVYSGLPKIRFPLLPGVYKRVFLRAVSRASVVLIKTDIASSASSGSTMAL